MKSHPVPKVGDTVVLNDEGLQRIFGHKLALQHMKTLRMKITHVDSKSMTEPEKTFFVDVDDKEINSYMIDHWCFDVVKDKATISFNINNNVLVKLTDRGRKIHRKEYENYIAALDGHIKIPSYRPPKEDEQGRSKWQLWALMSHFGRYVTLGMEVPFDTVIEIPTP